MLGTERALAQPPQILDYASPRPRRHWLWTMISFTPPGFATAVLGWSWLCFSYVILGLANRINAFAIVPFLLVSIIGVAHLVAARKKRELGILFLIVALTVPATGMIQFDGVRTRRMCRSWG
jgi:hypothetical protein